MKSDVYVLRVITDCTFSEHLSVLIVWLCDLMFPWQPYFLRVFYRNRVFKFEFMFQRDFGKQLNAKINFVAVLAFLKNFGNPRWWTF